ncbi:MAG: energy transducer TonB [Flavobacteriaceae bacterium]
MKLSKQHLSGDQPKALSKRKDKKSVSIKWNSKLFFQVGLIVALLSVYFIMQTKFKIIESKIATNETNYVEDPPIIFYTIDEDIKVPKKKIKLKQIEIQPKILDDIIKVDNNSTKETDVSKIDETKIKDLEIPVEPNKNTVFMPNKSIYNMLGVEKVPVYPGCENLATNDDKRNCMSKKIKKFIQRKFKTEQFNDLKINGKQTINVQFFINEDGEISNIMAKALNKPLEEEAIRVISKLPIMSPAKQGDKNVKVQYMIPIIFQID